jgi:hypothetical protein|tara:strand:+ start:322 stop:498 length:177 start_codon:yes stop_codon:yes gene_type:complete
MPNLYCENDCTKHEVELYPAEEGELQKIFDDIKYDFKNIQYDEKTKDIIITMKPLEEE